MNRFEHSEPSVVRRFAFWLPIAAFVLLFVLFLSGIRGLSDTTAAKQKESLETALSRSIAQCYAVEGVYPEDLDYLKEHYGLTYDEETFLVDYVSYGSNLRPEVTVLRKNH